MQVRDEGAIVEAKVAHRSHVFDRSREVSRSLVAIGWAVGEGDFEHVGEVRVDPAVSDQAELAPRDSRQDFEVALAGEQRLAGEHLGENDPDGKQIAARVHLCPEDLFG